MKTIKSVIKWTDTIPHAYRPFLLITVSCAALVTAGILWAYGVFEAANIFTCRPNISCTGEGGPDP